MSGNAPANGKPKPLSLSFSLKIVHWWITFQSSWLSMLFGLLSSNHQRLWSILVASRNWKSCFWNLQQPRQYPNYQQRLGHRYRRSFGNRRHHDPVFLPSSALCRCIYASNSCINHLGSEEIDIQPEAEPMVELEPAPAEETLPIQNNPPSKGILSRFQSLGVGVLAIIGAATLLSIVMFYLTL